MVVSFKHRSCCYASCTYHSETGLLCFSAMSNYTIVPFGSYCSQFLINVLKLAPVHSDLVGNKFILLKSWKILNTEYCISKRYRCHKQYKLFNDSAIVFLSGISSIPHIVHNILHLDFKFSEKIQKKLCNPKAPRWPDRKDNPGVSIILVNFNLNFLNYQSDLPFPDVEIGITYAVS